MKSRSHKKYKTKESSRPTPQAVMLTPKLAERLDVLADGRMGRYGLPVLILAASLLLAIGTFDSKLSLSGDNAEFIILARSLVQGQGLSYVNSPDLEPATKYPFGFPLLLAPLEWLFSGQWVPMKWLVVTLFCLSMPVFYWIAKEKLGVLPALAATALCVLTGDSSHSGGPLLLDYAHQVMSEIPYMAFSLLALGSLERGIRRPGTTGNNWLIGGFLSAMAAYYVRSVGMVLLAAGLICLLAQRQWRRALVFGGATVLLWLPWTLRNQAVGGGGDYFKQLFMVNPYYPDRGMAGIGELFARLAGNTELYLAYILPGMLWPWATPPHALLSPLPLAMIGLTVYVVAVTLKHRRDLLFFTYTAFYLGTVLLWFWPGDRFLVPLIPLLIFFVVRSFLDLRARLSAHHVSRRLGTSALWILWAGVLFANLDGLGRQATFARGDYPPHLGAWTNYRQAGEWLRMNTPAESIVLCRKEYWLHVISNRRTMNFPFVEPNLLLAYMERRQVDFVVVESLGFPQTAHFLAPAINQYRERFEILWQRDDPPTYVLRFQR